MPTEEAAKQFAAEVLVDNLDTTNPDVWIDILAAAYSRGYRHGYDDHYADVAS